MQENKTDSTRNLSSNKPGVKMDAVLNITPKYRSKQSEGSIRLGQVLLKEGLITRHQLAEALKIQERLNARLGHILVKLGYVENKTLEECLSKQLNVPVTNLDRLEIPPGIIKYLPYELAKQHLAIAIDFNDDTLTVVMADPSDSEAIEDLQSKTNLLIKANLASEGSIIEAFRKYYLIDEEEYASYTAGSLDLEEENLKVEEIEDYGKLLSDAVDVFGVISEEKQQKEEIYSAGDAPIVTLVQSIITKAIKMGVSDIHIEPFDKVYYVRYRLDGELFKTMNLPTSLKGAITSRIKILANLNIAERRLPQDGRIMLRLGKTKTIDIRVNTTPTIFGEGVVLRILDKSHITHDLTQLGFTPKGLKIFEEAITKPYGMALVTGPTGSGKTTTLYAALNKLNTINKKILTVEDPIEYNFVGINQIQAKEEIGLTFAHALRGFLRQDPDIIMVGEIRDLETAKIAFKAALTGHFVLSTLHTNDCSSSVGRLMDIGIRPFLPSSALTIVVAQRLLRRICERCKTPIANPDTQLLKKMGMDSDQLDSIELYQGKGCKECSDTGFKGRVAVYEILEFDDDIREAVSSKRYSEIMLRKVVREKEILSLRQEGLKKILDGVTTIEEVLQKTLVLGYNEKI
jgi:type IV pilus assembly protein PilB